MKTLGGRGKIPDLVVDRVTARFPDFMWSKWFHSSALKI